MPSLIITCGLLFLSFLSIVPLVNAHASSQVAIVDSESVDTYEAPLRHCNPEHVAPNEYIIYLVKGVSLGEHKQKVGEALQDSAIRVVFRTEMMGTVVYSVEMSADSLAIIRADESVDFVECNGIATKAF